VAHHVDPVARVGASDLVDSLRDDPSQLLDQPHVEATEEPAEGTPHVSRGEGPAAGIAAGGVAGTEVPATPASSLTAGYPGIAGEIALQGHMRHIGLPGHGIEPPEGAVPI